MPKFSPWCLWPPRPGGGGGWFEPQVDLSGVDVVLYAKFQPLGSNGEATYSRQINTHAFTHRQSHLLRRWLLVNDIAPFCGFRSHCLVACYAFSLLGDSPFYRNASRGTQAFPGKKSKPAAKSKKPSAKSYPDATSKLNPTGLSKSGMFLNFCFVKFSQKCKSLAVQTLFLQPFDLGG